MRVLLRACSLRCAAGKARRVWLAAATAPVVHVQSQPLAGRELNDERKLVGALTFLHTRVLFFIAERVCVRAADSFPVVVSTGCVCVCVCVCFTAGVQ